jgi:hypothetical protein
MTTAIDLMHDALFHDVNFSVDAVYRDPPTAPDGVSVPVLFVNQADSEAPLGQARGRKPQVVVELRAADIAEPAIGATLTIGTRVLTIAASERDRDRLIHRLTLREA